MFWLKLVSYRYKIAILHRPLRQAFWLKLVS